MIQLGQKKPEFVHQRDNWIKLQVKREEIERIRRSTPLDDQRPKRIAWYVE